MRPQSSAFIDRSVRLSRRRIAIFEGSNLSGAATDRACAFVDRLTLLVNDHFPYMMLAPGLPTARLTEFDPKLIARVIRQTLPAGIVGFQTVSGTNSALVVPDRTGRGFSTALVRKAFRVVVCYPVKFFQRFCVHPLVVPTVSQIFVRVYISRAVFDKFLEFFAGWCIFMCVVEIQRGLKAFRRWAFTRIRLSGIVFLRFRCLRLSAFSSSDS